MTMTEFLIGAIAIVLLLSGLFMAFSPGLLERLEQTLNEPIGERPVVSLRAGFPRERDIEPLLNRSVLRRAIYWDRWIRRHPRAAGALLLAAGAICAAAIAG